MRWLYATEIVVSSQIGLGKFGEKNWLFWVSLLVSSISNQLSHVAIGWQIYELTSSPLQLGSPGVSRLALVVSSLTGAFQANTLAQFRRARALIGKRTQSSSIRFWRHGYRLPHLGAQPLGHKKQTSTVAKVSQAIQRCRGAVTTRRATR